MTVAIRPRFHVHLQRSISSTPASEGNCKIASGTESQAHLGPSLLQHDFILWFEHWNEVPGSVSGQKPNSVTRFSYVLFPSSYQNSRASARIGRYIVHGGKPIKIGEARHTRYVRGTYHILSATNANPAKLAGIPSGPSFLNFKEVHHKT